MVRSGILMAAIVLVMWLQAQGIA